MQKGAYSEITAIARAIGKADEAAQNLACPRRYGSYETFAGCEIEASTNPLPNHFIAIVGSNRRKQGHGALLQSRSVPRWRRRRPFSRREPHRRKNWRAVLVKTHPAMSAHARTCPLLCDWKIASADVPSSAIFNRDPANVRHKVEWGGGGFCWISYAPDYDVRV